MRKKGIPGLFLLLTFTLGIYRGYVALWNAPTEKPIKVFPYSASSLPPADQDALSRGISANSREDLLHLLEDYLS